MSLTKRPREYGRLFLEFTRFGCFTFCGGWGIVAQMQQLYIEKENMIISEELMDLTSVTKSLPGMIIVNVAMLYGCRVTGSLGGFCAYLVCACHRC